ncbi:hypothetical protein [Dyadobacter sediminis]|uniref:Uncharacterized protein n=1 Tax=Dyadobacter sediminis TaxID=1493691 RepID=A0A5R9KKA5_9BACT|nr:hypothetical protein [Dyadobacter sediminis]TLU96650.1 hypothetical protein FEM55_05865 [Dyadobacter sediminis]GGB84028.1 hypothetical protein GCM10011325_09510 [Dyadobacter sediminis]
MNRIDTAIKKYKWLLLSYPKGLWHKFVLSEVIKLRTWTITNFGVSTWNHWCESMKVKPEEPD